MATEHCGSGAAGLAWLYVPSGDQRESSEAPDSRLGSQPSTLGRKMADGQAQKSGGKWS